MKKKKRWTASKLETFSLWKSLIGRWKDKLQTMRNIFKPKSSEYIAYKMHPHYNKNSIKQTIQLENEQKR